MPRKSLHFSYSDRPDNDRRKAESGLVLFFTLIALLILTLAAVTLTRSTDTAIIISSNLGFKRDLANQSEQAVALVKQTFSSGALSLEGTRWTNSASSNYSASALPSTAVEGVPNMLISLGSTATNSVISSHITDTTAGTTVITYVVDRLCNNSGSPNGAGTTCVVTATSDTGGSARLNRMGSTSSPVYRISVRVDGPRGTQGFYQTTFTTG